MFPRTWRSPGKKKNENVLENPGNFLKINTKLYLSIFLEEINDHYPTALLFAQEVFDNCSGGEAWRSLFDFINSVAMF